MAKNTGGTVEKAKQKTHPGGVAWRGRRMKLKKLKAMEEMRLRSLWNQEKRFKLTEAYTDTRT